MDDRDYYLQSLGLGNEYDQAQRIGGEIKSRFKGFRNKVQDKIDLFRQARSGQTGADFNGPVDPSGLGTVGAPGMQDPSLDPYGVSAIARVGHSLPEEGILAGSRRLSPYTRKVKTVSRQEDAPKEKPKPKPEKKPGRMGHDWSRPGGPRFDPEPITE